MENSTLESGKIGTIGAQEIDFADGKIVAKADVSAGGFDIGLNIGISGKVILDAIAKKIGGPIPAEIVQFLELSLGLK